MPPGFPSLGPPLERIPVSALLLDRESRIVAVNSLACELLGYGRGELAGIRLAGLIEGAQPSSQAAWLAARHEIRVRRKDGTSVEVSASAHAAGRGRALLFLRPEASSASECDSDAARHRIFCEASSEGLIIHERGSVLDANPALVEMLGYSDHELTAKKVWDLFAGPEWRAVVRKNVEADTEQPYEAVAVRKDGSQVPVEVRCRTFTCHGRSIRVACLRDLTERRRLEARLREAQKMEAVGRLAGGVAHDFNNLLTVINGYAQSFADTLPAEDPLRHSATEILTASERAAGLARQLLAFSRRQLLQTQVIDLNSVLANMSALIRRLAGGRIEVTTDFEAGLTPVKADPAQIGQVVINLVLNARDAMPDGGRLTLRTANADCIPQDVQAHTGLRSCVMLAVKDTGSGMDPETRTHLFEPFFTTKQEGTGLGLATAYGIVKQHGGDIAVTTEPGCGAEFCIYLPGTETPLPAAPPPEPEPRQRAGATVLLVEDAPAVRRLLREILIEEDYRVLEAPGAPEALEIAAAHAGPIDLLLTDIIMPEMNGHELAERLCASRPDTRVLFVSGYTDDAMREIAGKVNFLQKPFTPRALAERIRQVLA